MANAQAITLVCNQGSSERWTVTVTDEAGVAINLTGCTFEGMVREDYDTDVVAEFDFSVTNASAGQFAMSLSAADTALFEVDGPKKRFVFDVEMTAGNGDKTKILVGYLNVLREVTR